MSKSAKGLETAISSLAGQNDICSRRTRFWDSNYINKMLSYRRETALQGALVLAESGKLELGDNILWTL